MTLLQAAAICLLAVNSIFDIRKKKISLIVVVIFCVIRVAGLVLGEDDLAVLGEWIKGMLPGMVLCGMSIVSRGAIGLGDGVMAMAVGLYIGTSQTIEMILWAFFFAFFWSVFMMVAKKYKTGSSFAFVPFMLLGLIVSGLD